MTRPRPRWWRFWLLGLVCVVLATATLAAWACLRSAVPERLEILGRVPPFTLVERSGKPVTLDDLLGKVSVVNFFYTRCGDTCPLQSAHLARLQAEFAATTDLRLVSITGDPDHDTPAVLGAYAARYHADPRRWVFLTGSREAIHRLAVDGFHLPVTASNDSRRGPTWTWLAPGSAWAHEEATARPAIRLAHGSRFTLVDRQTQIRGYFDATDWADVDRLRADLSRLLSTRWTWTGLFSLWPPRPTRSSGLPPVQLIDRNR